MISDLITNYMEYKENKYKFRDEVYDSFKNFRNEYAVKL